MKINSHSPSTVFSIHIHTNENEYAASKHPAKNLIEIFQNSFIRKLEAKPKILNEISLLNSSIAEIAKKMQASHEKLIKLHGGNIRNLPFVGALIHYFFLWYNKSMIFLEEMRAHFLKNRADEHKEKISLLSKSLPTNDEENPKAILELDCQLRWLLEEDFPEKEEQQDIYNKKILPFLKKAIIEQVNESSSNDVHRSIALAAAAKGKAAQAGFFALMNLAQNQPIIKDCQISKHQVFLLPSQGVVFKDSREQPKEEEAIASALFDLLTPQAIVGSFNLRKASPTKFGIEISADERARGYTPEEMSSSFTEKIKKKLSSDALLILDKHAQSPSQIDPEYKNYQSALQSMWFVQEKDKLWKQIPFKELQAQHLNSKLELDTRIGITKKTAIPLKDHYLGGQKNQISLERAINYLPALQTPPQPLFLSPDLSHPSNKSAYQRCEKFQWSYVDENSKTVIVDFKTLHRHFVEGIAMTNIKAINDLGLPPSLSDLNISFNVPWKVVSLEIMKFKSGSLTELANIEAKPFIHDMILMRQLNHKTRSLILNRLTANAEFNAIMTGEIQLLDMYDKNLGVSPQATPEYNRFKNLTFKLSSGNRNFKELLLYNLNEQLSPNTLVEFTEDGKIIQDTLENLPDLRLALDVQWQLVIFDTDLSLTEDNCLQQQTYQTIEQHLIPLRSVLLETEWKNKPLSDSTVQRLMNSQDRDFQVEQWIKNKDAPIYKRLSKDVCTWVEQYTAPSIQKYNLSHQRKDEKKLNGTPIKQGEDVTIKLLRKQFIEEICDQSVHSSLWKKLEDTLSVATVREGDSWELLAKRYHQSASELENKNPGSLEKGKKIKIDYDLTSSNPDTKRKRERIAGQLFPRITYRQQMALLRRQKSRTDYLRNYQELLQSKLTEEQLLTQLKKFVMNSSTPLSSIRREEILNELSQLDSIFRFYKDLTWLKNQICTECQPTYFNVLKAMYPLLADAYALNLALYQNPVTAGRHIGLYTESLERSIALAKAKYPQGSTTLRLAQGLQKQIDAIENPAFFGHWN